MDVFFDNKAGTSFSIEVGYFDTVLEIKEKIQKYHGIPISRQTLIFNDNLLQDDRDVEFCQILQNSHIQLFVSPDPSTEKPVLINVEDSPPSKNLQEDPPSTKIQLILRNPTTKAQLSMDMDAADTVARLKEKIHETEGIAVNRITLHGPGGELQDHRSLRECELSDRYEIDVVVKPNPAAATGSGTKKLRLLVITKCGTKKIPVEVNPSDNVGELRKELARLQPRYQFHLPPEGYFFIYKQSVMDEDRSFRWHHVSQGDTVEIFNGSVTGGS